MTLRLVLADDHLLIRLGIKSLLTHLGEYEVVGEAHDGPTAICMLEELRPDLALVDIAMPGLSGIEVILHASRMSPETRLIVLSGMESPEIVREAMRSGAHAYLLKDCLMDELGEALRCVREHRPYITPRLNVKWPDEDCGPGVQLTARQVQILRMVAEGSTNKEIAKALEISPKTVEFHRGQLMQRLGLHDIAGLTRYATERGLIPRSSQ